MEGIFLFTNKYKTQLFNLFIGFLLIRIEGLLFLSTIVDNEVKKLVEYNKSLSFMKKDVSFIIK